MVLQFIMLIYALHYEALFISFWLFVWEVIKKPAFFYFYLLYPSISLFLQFYLIIYFQLNEYSHFKESLNLYTYFEQVIPLILNFYSQLNFN